MMCAMQRGWIKTSQEQLSGTFGRLCRSGEGSTVWLGAAKRCQRPVTTVLPVGRSKVVAMSVLSTSPALLAYSSTGGAYDVLGEDMFD
jgi:hypothetical protein